MNRDTLGLRPRLGPALIVQALTVVGVYSRFPRPLPVTVAGIKPMNHGQLQAVLLSSQALEARKGDAGLAVCARDAAVLH